MKKLLKNKYRFSLVDCNGKYHSYKDVLSLATNFNNQYDEPPINISYMGRKINCFFRYNKNNVTGKLKIYVDIEMLYKAMFCIEREITDGN